MYRIKVIKRSGYKDIFIPEKHVFLWIWSNINKDNSVRGSIFYPDGISTEWAYDANYTERVAKLVIEADKKYYRLINPTRSSRIIDC